MATRKRARQAEVFYRKPQRVRPKIAEKMTQENFYAIAVRA